MEEEIELLEIETNDKKVTNEPILKKKKKVNDVQHTQNNEQQLVNTNNDNVTEELNIVMENDIKTINNINLINNSNNERSEVNNINVLKDNDKKKEKNKKEKKRLKKWEKMFIAFNIIMIFYMN